MDAKSIKEGETLYYKARVHTGKAKVTQTYTDTRGTYWVALHDKARNRAVTVRPSQVSRKPFKA
jgi:hypothetical protein